MDIDKKVEEKTLSSIINSIQIALDGYDDIFSDFDPSPYNQRILSDDFIKEMQKRYIETKKGDFEVRFSLPQAIRDPKTETLVKKRLRDYFSYQIKETDAEIEGRKKSGILRLLIGALLLTIELSGSIYDPDNIVLKIIGILIIPAGWFAMYSGLELIFDHPQKLTEHRTFLKKFHDAIYLFVAEEELVKNIETTSDQKPLEIFLSEKEGKGETKKQ